LSLVSRKSIQRAGPDKHEEVVKMFRKEQDGTYTKITKKMVRDHKTGLVKESKSGVAEDGPYEKVSAGQDFDEETRYEDPDGNIVSIFFKRRE